MIKKATTIIKESFHRSISFTWIATFLLSFGSCKGDNENGFKADFDFSFKDANRVEIINTSEGEYHSLIWDFGNNTADTTTDKNKSYIIYYPLAGDYDISLKLLNYTGATQSVKKTVNINSSDLVVSFTAEVVASHPNRVLLKNTSQGSYDNVKWMYRNKVIENVEEHEAYFPYAGNYQVQLLVTKHSENFSESKTVNISQDDPYYHETFVLVWSDEFNGSEINTNYWTFETGSHGWGNQELQNYTNGNNAEIVDSVLILTARKVNDNMQPGSYTSTRMISRGKKEFQYGKMEIRAKLPSGVGIWPAIWMLGSNFTSVGWPACGEMDIMEYVGYQPNTVHATVHTPSGYGSNGNGNSMIVETCEEEFHVYGMIWTEKEIIFYVDEPANRIHTYSPPVKTLQNWPFDQPAFFILNIAVGGTWGGAEGIDNSIFPQTMEIDYVRVYQEAIK